MTETKLFIGLNDSVTMKQEFETEKYVRILRYVCEIYHIPFSFSLQEGGYIHEDGRYTHETSLVMSLIDVDPGTVQEIARDMCTFFRQESVLVTESEVKSYMIHAESLFGGTEQETAE